MLRMKNCVKSFDKNIKITLKLWAIKASISERSDYGFRCILTTYEKIKNRFRQKIYVFIIQQLDQ